MIHVYRCAEHPSVTVRVDTEARSVTVGNARDAVRRMIQCLLPMLAHEAVSATS
jgi:hypothetical protein